jgi:hypothetical protein
MTRLELIKSRHKNLPKKKLNFKGVFNFSGQLITLYAHAYSESRAKKLFITKLSDRLGWSESYLKGYFSGTVNNYEIRKEVK